MLTKEENILFAAEKLFAQKGFKGTSTREISSAADVNISMISYYFGSKEKLYEEVLMYRANQSRNFASEVLSRTDINEWEKLILIIERFSENIKTNKDYYIIMQREQLHTNNPSIKKMLRETKMSFMTMYSQLLEEGCEKGVFKNKVPSYLLHSTISGTLFFSINTKKMYKEFLGVKGSDESFEEDFYKELNQHIKNILKHLLGYEEHT